MPEILAEAAPAAVEALQSKRWREDAPWSAHASHRYDSDCAVCGGDVPEIVAAVLEAAAPILAEQFRRDAALALRTVAENRELRHRFVDRHPVLHEGATVSAVLLAVADEIEGNAHDPR